MDLGLPIVYKHLKSDAFDENNKGLGDMLIAPLGFYKHRGICHFVVSPEFIVPTGSSMSSMEG